MQEIESVIDELHIAFAVGRRLGGRPASSQPDIASIQSG